MRKAMILICWGMIIIFIFTACTKSIDADEVKSYKIEAVEENKTVAADVEPLQENKSVYEQDEDISVKHIYITINKANNIRDGKMTTFSDLLNYKWTSGLDSPKVEVFFEEGDKNGPYEHYLNNIQRSPNASMEVRGRSATLLKQKSFKIRLYEKAGLWQGLRILNLNKHPKDLTRIRNKLCMDLFKSIPNFASLRTQFVNLHIKDLSPGGSGKFEDYGLYTNVENPNKTYLKSHGFDSNGNLYKAENFEFFRYRDKIRLSYDPLYDKKEFESVLQINGNDDHRKLIAMLDDLNDRSKNINDIVEKHFNRDNILTWLAVNILTGNIDTNSNNFMLYSPLNSDTWYFLPWDYDVSFGIHEQLGSSNEIHPDWKYGISNYWGMVLFNRFLRISENLEALNKKIEELQAYINEDSIKALTQKYHDVVKEYVSKAPDLRGLPSKLDYYEKEYERIAKTLEKNKRLYYESIQKPMPFYLWDVTIKDGHVRFLWDVSFDFQKDKLLYDISVSTNPRFTNIIKEGKDLSFTEFEIEALKDGIYYWRVKVHDDKGYMQYPFDYYSDGGTWYFGVKQFIIQDGNVIN